MIDIEEGSPQEDVQRKQQMLMQEEYDMEQLQERQRQINQLEVNKISDGVRYTYTKVGVLEAHWSFGLGNNLNKAFCYFPLNVS